MDENPRYLEPVPPVEAGGATYQEMAEATDEAVCGMMINLRSQHPGMGGAILAGTCGGLARYQLQGMPPGTSGQQVLEVVAPIIRTAAVQLAEAHRIASGKPPPKVTVVAPLKQGFDKLTAALSGAPFKTFCISTEDGLLLISVAIHDGGVLTHGSQVNLSAACTRPEEVIHAHCVHAHQAWTLQKGTADGQA